MWVSDQATGYQAAENSGTKAFQLALQSVLCQTKLQRDVSHHISLLWLVISEYDIIIPWFTALKPLEYQV